MAGWLPTGRDGHPSSIWSQSAAVPPLLPCPPPMPSQFCPLLLLLSPVLLALLSSLASDLLFFFFLFFSSSSFFSFCFFFSCFFFFYWGCTWFPPLGGCSLVLAGASSLPPLPRYRSPSPFLLRSCLPRPACAAHQVVLPMCAFLLFMLFVGGASVCSYWHLVRLCARLL